MEESPSSSDDQYIENVSDSDEDVFQDECSLPKKRQVSIEDLKKWPHKGIGAIFANMPQKETSSHRGTGFLIAPNLALTSAHVLFDQGKILTNIKFSLCPIGDEPNMIGVKDFRVPKEYLEKDWRQRNKDGALPFDYAMLKLEQSIPLDKYFTLVNKFSNEMAKISIFGYPQFFKNGISLEVEQTGFVGDQNLSILKVDTLKMKLVHLLQTSNGHSGSPVLINNDEVIGIQKAQTASKSLLPFIKCAVLVNSQMLSNLRKWEEQMNMSNKSKIVTKEYLRQYSLKNSGVLITQTKQLEASPTKPSSKKGLKEKEDQEISGLVGRIVTEHKQYGIQGLNTAFLISPDLVLTCFNCVYSPLFKNKFTMNDLNITFFPSNSSQGYPVSAIRYNLDSANLEISPDTNNKNISMMLEDVEWDFCLLKLKDKIKCKSYLELMVNFSDFNTMCSSYGCPSLNEYGAWLKEIVLEETTTNIYNLKFHPDKKLICHQMGTKKGMMGGPLVVFKNKVIGFHKLRFSKSRGCKVARLITIDLVDRLFRWKKELEAQPFKAFYFQEENKYPPVGSSKEISKLHAEWKGNILKSK